MSWPVIVYLKSKTAVYNKISSISRQRAERNQTSIRSKWAGLEIGNFFAAVSTTGFMALGVFPVSLPLLISLAVIFLVLGIIGRYIDAVEDDVERLLKYEKHISESASSSDAITSSTDSVQQQSN